MTILNFTRAERAAWQRRAVTELARILDRHRELPLLAWTVGPAGSVLLGQIATPTGRDGFDAWCHALALVDRREQVQEAVTYLSAKSLQDSVRVVLNATLIDDGGRT